VASLPLDLYQSTLSAICLPHWDSLVENWQPQQPIGSTLPLKCQTISKINTTPSSSKGKPKGNRKWVEGRGWRGEKKEGKPIHLELRSTRVAMTLAKPTNLCAQLINLAKR